MKYLVMRPHNAALASAGYRPWSALSPETRRTVVQSLAQVGFTDVDWMKEFWWRVDDDGWAAAHPRVRRR